MADKEAFLTKYSWLKKGDRIKVIRSDYPEEWFSHSPKDTYEGTFNKIDESCLYLWVDEDTQENPALENIVEIEKLS